MEPVRRNAFNNAPYTDVLLTTFPFSHMQTKISNAARELVVATLQHPNARTCFLHLSAFHGVESPCSSLPACFETWPYTTRWSRKEPARRTSWLRDNLNEPTRHSFLAIVSLCRFYAWSCTSSNESRRHFVVLPFDFQSIQHASMLPFHIPMRQREKATAVNLLQQNQLSRGYIFRVKSIRQLNSP